MVFLFPHKEFSGIAPEHARQYFTIAGNSIAVILRGAEQARSFGSHCGRNMETRRNLHQ